MNRHTDPRVLQLARRWFGRATAARVFEPLAADWQHEWLEARSIRQRMRVWVSGTAAAALTFALVALRVSVASPTLRRVVRQTTLWSALFSIDAIADARHQPWPVAGVSVLISATSWLPVVAMMAMWQSRRYARMWRVGLVITAMSAIVALGLTGWVQPRAVAAADSPSANARSVRTLPLPAVLTASPSESLPKAALQREQLVRLGPVVFALLSGVVAVGHLRTARRRGHAYSARYVFAGTAACTGFLLFVNAARGAGVDRSVAMMTATAVVMAPAAALFLIVCEAERRRLVRSRPRLRAARPAV